MNVLMRAALTEVAPPLPLPSCVDWFRETENCKAILSAISCGLYCGRTRPTYTESYVQSKLLPLLQRNSLFFPLTLALPYHPYPFNTNSILFSFTSICVPASHDRVRRNCKKVLRHFFPFLSLFPLTPFFLSFSLVCTYWRACVSLLKHYLVWIYAYELYKTELVLCSVCACAQCTHPTYVAIGTELSSTSTTTKHFHDVIKYFVVFKCSIFRFSSDVGVGVWVCANPFNVDV